jgi:hypothetical protein
VFEEIKEYLARLPVLVPPQRDRSFYIYLLVGDTSIASVVVQVYDSKEKVVFYLSRRILDMETRYHKMEKLCLICSSPAQSCGTSCSLQR